MGCGEEKLSKYLTQTFIAHCNAMICQQVTLSGDAEWPKVADAVIEAKKSIGIGEFMVLGFCIGGPFIWNLLQRAPERIVAAVLAQPSGFRPELPDLSYQNNMKGWGPALCARRPDIMMEMVHDFLTNMYTKRADF